MNEFTPTHQFEEEVHQSFGVPKIRSAFVDQLYGEIMHLADTKLQKPRTFIGLRPAWMVTLVIIILMSISILIIGPHRVYAAVLQLFGYIPGVGIVDQSSSIRILAEPVSITRDGITVTVTSATLTSEKTYLDYRIFGVPGSAYPDHEDKMGCIQQPYLLLPDGSQLDLEKYFPPIPDQHNKAVLFLPCILNTLPGTVPENWEIPLQFVTAPPNFNFVPVIEIFPSQTPSVFSNNNLLGTSLLEINKVMDIGDQFILMGEFKDPVVMDDTLPAGSWWVLKNVSIIGDDGREVPQNFSNDFDLPSPTTSDSEPWLFQLKKDFVLPITITWMGEIISPVGSKEQVAFEFDAGQNPQEGSQWEVNKDFKLGKYNIRLVSIQSNAGGYSFHFLAEPGASANLISVDIAGYTPICGGGGGGSDFSEEFDRSVCVANSSDSPEFPHGKLVFVINFQALERQNKSYQVKWNPDPSQTEPFATFTPKPGVCVLTGSFFQNQPASSAPSNGKGLIYEKLVSGKWGLVLYNLNGNKLEELTSEGNWGALSLDGEKVAYSGLDSSLHIIDLVSRSKNILPGNGGFNLHWSPDGKQIAYVGMGDGVINSVFVINTNGENQPQQVSDQSYQTVIGWSEDSNKLYFATPFTGGAAWKVFSYDLSDEVTQELFTIENGTPKFLNAKISPDGNWIAYRGRDNSSLYLVHPDGSNMHLLIDNAGVVGVEWSNSGWLGMSMKKQNSDQSVITLIKPDACEIQLLPITIQGDLQGLFVP